MNHRRRVFPFACCVLGIAACALGQSWSVIRDRAAGMLAGAYDPVRQRPVVAMRGLGNRSELLEWDGTWQRRPGGDPPLRDPVMVTDTVGQRVLAFGLATGAPPTGAYRFDGVRWQPFAGVSAPAAYGYAITFDSLRNRVLAFGGQDNRPVDSMHQWDGVRWTPIQRGVGPWPAPRSHAAFAFDPARGRAVLFGGMGASFAMLNDTWEWDGTAWSQFAGAAPPARYMAAMQYDAASQAAVLFGGVGAAVFGDTWQFDGTQWTRVATPLAPPARIGPTLIPTPGALMLVGGSSDSSHAPSDTWLFGGGTWIEVAPDEGPPGRSGAAMDYDRVRGEAVLYGGLSDSFTGFLRDDLWTWDGAWRRRQPTTMPPRRTWADMAFDAARGEMILFGGAGFAGPLADTWVWDGQDWSARTPAVLPPARRQHRLVYDDVRQRIVLFGGFDGVNALDDTWVWNGATWTRVSTPLAPPPRRSHAMAFDRARGRTVLFAGFDGPTQHADTWLFDGVAWLPAAPTAVPDSFADCEYDVRRAQVVALGTFREWAWTGADWVATAFVGPTRSQFEDAAACFDERRERMLVFGGEQYAPDGWLHVYTPTPAAVETYGAACAPAGGQAPDLFASHMPRPGQLAFALGLRADAPARPMLLALGWQAQSVPLAGCNLLVGQIDDVRFVLSGADAFAQSFVPVPDVLAFRGLVVNAQSFALLPGGLAGSAGLRIAVGD